MPIITAPGTAPRPKRFARRVEYFGGVDLTNQPANVDSKRGCEGTNMIRDVPGKIRKRTGYHLFRKYPHRINGVFSHRGKTIVHSGSSLYADAETPALIRGGMADAKSDAVRLAGKLWITDGKKLLCYDGEKVFAAEDAAYIPTVSAAKPPSGGGVTYEPVNMLTPARRDSFLGTADAAVYQLSFGELTSAPVTAKKLISPGRWADLTEGRDFSVDRAAGKAVFSSPPGVSPVTGEDNVVITYSAFSGDYADRVNGCTFGICYGVSGTADRLFISGNPAYPNYDFYSQLYDPTYFGDLWYCAVGQEHSPIMGYSIIGGALAAHKRNDDNGRNIYLRAGILWETPPEGGEEPLSSAVTAEFRITGVIQGEGAAAVKSFGDAREPIFLTAAGISSATPYEYNSERYVQNRGIYLNGTLLREPGLAEAHACVWNEFYMLALNGKVYILDTQEYSYAERRDGSYQYEAYLWDNVPARVLYTLPEEDASEALYFGTAAGEIFKFYPDADDVKSYMDGADPAVPGSGRAIAARWDFDDSGGDFYRGKHYRYIAVMLAPSVATGITAAARVRGTWVPLIDGGGGRARYFSFSRAVFSKFGFSGDANPRTVGGKIKIKRADSVRFSLRNAEPMEPFGIYEIALEYTLGGYYK